MIPEDRLLMITLRFQYLEAAMAGGSTDIATLAKEYSDLRPVVAQIEAYKRIVAEIAEAETMLADPDMAELAREELPQLKIALP